MPDPVRARARFVIASFSLGLALSACGDDDPTDPGHEDAPLECDRLGYPCSLADVALATLQRGEALADSAAVMFADGTPGAQVGAWLAQREGVVESMADDYAAWFRLEGGVPIWIIDDRVRPGEAAAASESAAAAAGARADVVGDDTGVKRALVLSPFAWQFGAFDGSVAVAATLGGTRGYDGRVQHLEVAAETSPHIPLSVFTTWDAFDVVHVSSHGETVCNDAGCRATLALAIDNRPIEQVSAEWNSPGLSFAIGPSTGNRYVVANADFFRHHYPEGVGDVLVYLDACETLTSGATDLADAIRGEEGVFVGWSAAVQSGPAGAAAVAFYTRLSEAGVTAGTAYADIGDLKTNLWTDEQGNNVDAQMRITQRQAGGDLRIRDIVWIEHPAGGAPLDDDAIVLIPGTLGDGQPDSVPYRIRIDGADAPAADFTIHVEIDGVAAAPATLSGAQSAGELAWVLTGSLAMGRDLANDEVLEVHARAELPDAGTSQASALVRVMDDPGYWVGTSIYFRETEDTFEMVEGVDLRFEYNPDMDRFDLTEGTLMWSEEGSTFNAQGDICTYEVPPTPVQVAPGSAYIVINYGTSPARHSVYGDYEGPIFPIPTSCPNVTLPGKFFAAWLYSGGAHDASEDGNTINGYYEQDFGFLVEGWAWEFERRSN
ncbi:MAG: hypothetical protein ACREM1_09420 [Longimicrobiales bacterium]